MSVETSPEEGTLTIGKIAKLAGVGVETIRFYERKGLVVEPSRPRLGYRQYPAATVSRIRFIKRAQGLGFSLREINELLSLRIGPETSRQDVRSRAEAKIAELNDKMASLRRMRDALSRLTVACCEGNESNSECPILEALDQEGR